MEHMRKSVEAHIEPAAVNIPPPTPHKDTDRALALLKTTGAARHASVNSDTIDALIFNGCLTHYVSEAAAVDGAWMAGMQAMFVWVSGYWASAGDLIVTVDPGTCFPGSFFFQGKALVECHVDCQVLR